MKHCLIVLLLISSFWSSAKNQLIFDHITNEDGLPNNSVKAIFQDKQGYMWFGTLNGLCRYDGQNVKTFKYTDKNIYSIGSYKIWHIFQDSKGYIWTITYEDLALRFNPETETFLNFPDKLNNFIKTNKIKRIYETSPGVIWLAFRKNGCARIIYTKKAPGYKIDFFNTKNILPSDFVNIIKKGKNNEVWIGTNSGLCYLPNDKIQASEANKTKKFIHNKSCKIDKICTTVQYTWAGSRDGKLFRIKDNNEKLIWQTPNQQDGRNRITGIKISHGGLLCVCSYKGVLLIDEKKEKQFFYSTNNCGLTTCYISSCYHDQHDDFWLITSKRGVTRFQVKERKFTTYPLNPELRQTILEGEKQQFCEDKNGDLWVSVYGGGISRFNRKTEKFEQYLHDENNPKSLSSNLILSIYCDISGNIWSGTYKRGINRINLRRSNFNSFQLDPNAPKGFSNEVRAIFEDSRKWIWTGNKRGDVVVFDQNMKQLFALNDLNIPLRIKSGVYAIEEDHKHRMWIGTKGEGIYIIENIPTRITPSEDTRLMITHLTKISDETNSLAYDDVFDIHEDNQNQMWVALYHGGINIIQNPLQANQNFFNYVHDNKDTLSISDDRVRCIKEDTYGNMWIGTARGLNFLSSEYKTKKDKKFINSIYSDEKSKLPSCDIISLFAEEKGNIYIGTYGEGVLKYTPGENKNLIETRNITPINDLSSNLILSIIEDNKNNLWVGTDFGLNKLNSETGKIEKYYKESGLTENSFSEGNCLKTTKGDLIFGHISGLLWFNPASIRKSAQKVPVVLTRLMVNSANNKEKLTEARNVIRHKKQELCFKYNENFLTFEFAALDYKAPEKILYTFKLEGYEKKWNTEGNLNTAIYRDLQPGTYTLRMKASNSEGLWVNPELKLKIEILPPPWETIWAYLFYTLFSIGIFILIRKFTLERLRLKHEVEFEKQLVDEKLKFYTSTSHEFKTPLALIYGLVEDLLSSKKISEEIKSSLLTVRKNTNRLLELIDQLMDFRKIQKGVFNIKKQQGNPVTFLNEIYQAFLPLAKRKEIKLEYNYKNSTTNAFTDYKALEKIIFNLLSNAFKHTEAQKTIELILATNTETNEMVITVKDQGEGISEENLPHIFERFNLGKSKWKEDSSSGVGLSLCKEMVELLDGEILVDSQIGTGSCFTVRLPNCINQTQGKFIEDDYNLNYTNHFIKSVENKQQIEQSETNISSGKEETILIVEDNTELQDFLKEHLIGSYNILQAINGKKGLDIAHEKNPDLIICDIMMPEMDGIEMTSILKNEFRTSHIPIILLTAKSMDVHKIEGIEIGADDYITKPFNMEYLQKRVKNILTQRKQLKERFSQQVESKPKELAKFPKDQEFLSKVIELIEENMKNPDFTVDTLIGNFHYGRTVFYKKMKGISGYAPKDFIRIIRMKKAGKLFLEDPSLTVAEVSFMIGYDEPAYFSKIFKKHFGQTPSEYKKGSK